MPRGGPDGLDGVAAAASGRLRKYAIHCGRRVRDGWGTGLSCAPPLPKPGHPVLSHLPTQQKPGELRLTGESEGLIRTSGLGLGIICLGVIASPSLQFPICKMDELLWRSFPVLKLRVLVKRGRMRGKEGRTTGGESFQVPLSGPYTKRAAGGPPRSLSSLTLDMADPLRG